MVFGMAWQGIETHNLPVTTKLVLLSKVTTRPIKTLFKNCGGKKAEQSHKCEKRKEKSKGTLEDDLRDEMEQIMKTVTMINVLLSG